MGAIELTAIFSILLLVRVEYLVARPTENTPCRNASEPSEHSTQGPETTIENNILKGPTVAIDGRKIGQIIFDLLSESPDHLSQIDAETENQITFRKMKDRSIRLALWIQKLGISPTDVVVECSQNHVDSYVPFLATFFVDAIFSAWHPNPSLDGAQHLMQQYSPKLIFTDDQSANILLEAAILTNATVKIVVFEKHASLQSLDEILSLQTDEEIENFAVVNKKSPEETAAILTTSGTTGFPKGVLLSGKSVSATAKAFRGIDSSQPLRVLWYTNISWISCFRLMLQTILQKYVRVVSPRTNIDEILRTIEKYNISVVRLPLRSINLFAKSELVKNYNLNSLKVILMSGVKISLGIFEQFQRNFPNVFIQYIYGSTELGGHVTERNPNQKLTDSVGYTTPNTLLKIVDLNSSTTLGPKQSGEIHVKSPTMMTEYYDNPETTKQVIDKEGWYHSGDIGYYAANGEVFVLGRVKDIIRYKNYVIVPSEIESILLSHSGIEEAVVVPIPHKVDGHWPVAFVKKVPGSDVSKNDLMEVMSVHEDYKQLRGGIHFVDTFPLSPSQKVAKNKLIEMAVNMSKSESS